MTSSVKFALIGFVTLMAGVGLGAFGAHGLKESLNEKSLETYQTGIQYLFYHGLGALALASLSHQLNLEFNRSRIALLLGLFIFSGGCMLYAVTGQKFLAMIVPIGGIGYLLCWSLAIKELAQKFKNASAN